MCFAKTFSFRPPREIRRKATVPDDPARAAHQRQIRVGYGAGVPAAAVTGVEAANPPPVGRVANRHWRTDALILAIATVVIRIAAFLAEKSLVFDDGVFASSARAMRNGELP